MVEMSGALTSLARARAAHYPGSLVPHTIVMLPSYSMSESLLAEYSERLLDMEHRHLLSTLMLPLIPGARMIFVTSRRPEPVVLDYYLSLCPVHQRRSMRARLHILDVQDSTARSVTTKLLGRPDLLARIQQATRGRLAYIEPWNVTAVERAVAEKLGLPIHGTAPELWPLAFKSSGRRLLRLAGVPPPLGHEDVRTVEEVVAAAEDIRARQPDAAGVVVKTDNSAAGEGNRVIRFSGDPSGLRRDAESLGPRFVSDLAAGGVVEELIQGRDFSSPSVQVRITAEHDAEVVSTHEQLLGGEADQVYRGCEFPARADYAPTLARYGALVGGVLAERGVLGPFSVDFAVVRSSTTWAIRGLEINLRKSGTSHPLSVLHNLTPGEYDADRAEWVTAEGTVRCYRSTDVFSSPALRDRTPAQVIRALRDSGLAFDRQRGAGVVLHGFCGLARPRTPRTHGDRVDTGTGGSHLRRRHPGPGHSRDTGPDSSSKGLTC